MSTLCYDRLATPNFRCAGRMLTPAELALLHSLQVEAAGRRLRSLPQRGKRRPVLQDALWAVVTRNLGENNMSLWLAIDSARTARGCDVAPVPVLVYVAGWAGRWTIDYRTRQRPTYSTEPFRSRCTPSEALEMVPELAEVYSWPMMAGGDTIYACSRLTPEELRADKR